MSMSREAPASAFAGRGFSVPKIGARSLFVTMLAVVKRWRNRRMVVNMLDFDDAQLADIGLSRRDVETALRMPVNLDPTLHLIQARQNPLRGFRRR
jgi:uncharacterized protein YjiS (DUF1127 family)